MESSECSGILNKSSFLRPSTNRSTIIYFVSALKSGHKTKPLTDYGCIFM